MAAGKEGSTSSDSTAKKKEKSSTPLSVVEKAILELAQGVGQQPTNIPPQPPPDSPNANDILSQLSAQVSGLHEEREQQTNCAKEQLAETEKQLKALREEYESYRADVSKKLSLLSNNNGENSNSNDSNSATSKALENLTKAQAADLAAARASHKEMTEKADSNTNAGAEENKYKRLLYDLQEQLLLQVEATEQQSSKRVQLERQLKEERREILRLRDSMHDARARYDEKEAELQEQIQKLDVDLTSTSNALRDASELLEQRDIQIATLQANNQSLRKLMGKMRRLIIKRTRNRLSMIKERIMHPLQRHRPKSSRSAIPNSTTTERRYSSIATTTRTSSTTQASYNERPISVALVDKEK